MTPRVARAWTLALEGFTTVGALADVQGFLSREPPSGSGCAGTRAPSGRGSPLVRR